MRVALEALDVAVDDAVLAAVGREVEDRVRAPEFAGARDLRVRLRRVKGAFLGVAMVGFSAGGLATSTATSSDPLSAMVSALDALPERMGHVQRRERRGTTHTAVRAELKRLLDRA